MRVEAEQPGTLTPATEAAPRRALALRRTGVPQECPLVDRIDMPSGTARVEMVLDRARALTAEELVALAAAYRATDPHAGPVP